jgi:glycosyltransferase involved in cell wall biosynthesis
LVVIHREVFPFLTPMLEKWVLNHHPKVVFSLDDATYAVHPDHVHMNHPLLYRLKYGRRLDEVIGRSAHVIVGNSTLAKYARQFNTEVSIIPTVVDCGKYKYRSAAKPDGCPLTVGWMGSRSTAAYLLNIVRPLRKLAETYGDRVNFRFFGCEDLELDLPNTVVQPFRLEAELDDLRSLDIGLMPMPDTEWTRGKCAFKAVQYMAMGIPAVASPVGATLDLIQHDHNGLLARSEQDWYRALEKLITDRPARERLSMAGCDTVLKSYSLQVWGPRLTSLFDQLLQPCFSGADLPAVVG